MKLFDCKEITLNRRHVENGNQHSEAISFLPELLAIYYQFVIRFVNPIVKIYNIFAGCHKCFSTPEKNKKINVHCTL